MNVQLQGSSLFMGNRSILQNSGLKSTQEKMQRQTQRDNQIAFWENQKSNLKNMECGSLEEISRKLELFHSYEDQIAAAKEEYNQSQMFNAMEEVKERGEQIAKAAEKYAPKTPEERREELAEEALGTDENKGMLTESMEELAKLAEEVTGEISEISEDIPQEELAEGLSDEVTGDTMVYGLENAVSSETAAISEIYKRIDIRI